MTSSPTPLPSTSNPGQADRLASLDQFRGYTVAGMFLVNFVGSFAAIAAFLPTLKHWNNHCSYADTIMPQFLFAVGFGFRMSFLSRREKLGGSVDYWRIIRRILGLLLVALFVHGLDGQYRTWQDLLNLGFVGFLRESFQRNYFQTLTHIGVTSLWVVPVIGARSWVRCLYAACSGLLFIFLSYQWYYDWEMTTPGIDGGPLGFLTWTAPLMLGTLAYDICRNQRFPALTTFSMGCAAMLVAYGLSCISTFTFPNSLPAQATWKDRLADRPWVRPIAPVEPQNEPSHGLSWSKKLTVSGSQIPLPAGQAIEHWVTARDAVVKQTTAAGKLPEGAIAKGVPMESWRHPDQRYLNQWTMSQRSGSLSYTLFGGGLAMAIFGLMLVVCDRWGWQAGVFRTLGVNALIGYILHDLVSNAVRPFVPNDSPLWWVFVGFAVYFGICYLVLRTIEKQKIFFKL